MKALVIEHDPLSRPERVGAHLERRGVSLEHFVLVADMNDPEVFAEFPRAPHDILVVMGAPWSIYEPRVQGWVQPELDLIRGHMSRGAPVLGICFGAQAVSKAMGGVVRRSSTPEYGWGKIASTTDSISDGPWFQFHHDDFTLPPGAEALADNDAGLQAFQLGPSLCVQFHPEVTTELISSWCGAGGDQELLANGIDPTEVIEETRLIAPQTQDDLETMLDAWLERMGSG